MPREENASKSRADRAYEALRKEEHGANERLELSDIERRSVLLALRKIEEHGKVRKEPCAIWWLSEFSEVPAFIIGPPDCDAMKDHAREPRRAVQGVVNTPENWRRMWGNRVKPLILSRPAYAELGNEKQQTVSNLHCTLL